MSDRHPRNGGSWWPSLVELARQLLKRSNAADHQELIRHAVEALLGGRATVWLNDPDDHSPLRGAEWSGNDVFCSEALRRAAQTGRTEAIAGADGHLSLVASPVVAGDCLLGVIQVERERGHSFSPPEITIIEALAGQAAIGIEAARRASAQRARALEQAWVSTAMVQVARALQSQPSLEETLATAARLAPMLAGTERSAALMIGDDGYTILPRAAYGLTLTQRIGLYQLLTPDDATEFESMLAAHAPARVDRGPLVEPLAAAGFDSPIVLPLLGGDGATGVLVIDAGQRQLQAVSDPPGTADPGWVQIARGIAQQTSAAIESHELRQSQREEAYVSTALLQVVQAIATLTNLDDVLASIVRTTPALVGAERCAIYRWIEEEELYHSAQVYGMARPAKDEREDAWYRPGEYPLLDTVRREVCPVSELLPQTPAAMPGGKFPSSAEGFERPRLTAPRQRAVRALPLVVKGEFVGALVLVEPAYAERSGNRREEILRGIADQAAIAIQNDRLQAETSRRERLEQEMLLAHDIQRSLMPDRFPETPGWQLAAICEPAREVGGDFFDLIRLPDESLGLVIADVADKGMPAALFMANARAMIRALAHHHRSPAAVLEQVNHLLLPDSHQGMFVTALFASLSVRGGMLTYCNAGHNPPLVWRAQQHRTERLETGGTALAVLADPRLEDHSLRLDSGDWLVLYTDGVTEAFSDRSESFHGEDRLCSAIEANASGGAQQMLDAIQESVRVFVGETPPSDDLTVLVVRRDDDQRAVVA